MANYLSTHSTVTMHYVLVSIEKDQKIQCLLLRLHHAWLLQTRHLTYPWNKTTRQVLAATTRKTNVLLVKYRSFNYRGTTSSYSYMYIRNCAVAPPAKSCRAISYLFKSYRFHAWKLAPPVIYGLISIIYHHCMHCTVYWLCLPNIG